MEDTHKKEKKKLDEDSEERLEVYPAEEQGILPEETEEEIKEDMDTGEKEEDVYSEEGRENLEEDDEIDNWEEGFMQGASGTGQLGKDALTGEPLMGEETVELEIDGEKYRFVNSENAERFRKKKEKNK
jgi:hypothetical protein